MTDDRRVALVTGGGRGIGRAICTGLARDGISVAVNYRRDEAAARTVCAELTALGVRAACYQAVIADDAAAESLAERVLHDFGRVDILVKNAGVASRGHLVADTDPAEVTRLIGTNVLGPMRLTQRLLPQMRGRRRGDIIFISSTMTVVTPANGGAYTIAKAAMQALAQTLAKEEREHGVHVNAVAPGLVRTDMGERLAKGAMGVDEIDELAPTLPFGRVCEPDDVAGAVRWLVSDQAAYVTGEVVKIWGGGE